jgi:hypothetical protein
MIKNVKNNWKDDFKKGKELILSTSSKNGTPHANIVISLGFIGNKLLVADCQMKTTINNLKDNKKICVIGGYIRLKGAARIYSSGKYFNSCVRENHEFKVKNAILINVKNNFDLDKGIKINLK